VEKKIFCYRLFWFLIPLLLLTIFSCRPKNSAYPGYSSTSSGLYYKLLDFSDARPKPLKGHFFELSVVYKTDKDSIFLDSKNQNPIGTVMLPCDSICNKGLLGEGLMKMNEGDSMSFVLGASDLFSRFFHSNLPLFLTKNSLLKVDARLIRNLDKNEYEAELEKFEEALSTWDVEENRRIKNYLRVHQLPTAEQQSGIFYIPLIQGGGAQADSGKVVQVRYTGRFMDGKKFDDSGASGTLFEFRLGDEYQVIWGLQLGIKLMKEGGQAKIIIPSYLAYGEEGSSTGIVPPYTTVIYEVELIKVK